MSRPAPAFEAPWHAQLFALTVSLNEAGHFAWSDWADAFGATLARHGRGRDLDGGDDYFNAWLETLEEMLRRCGLAETAQITELTEAWRAAYLTTSHGAVVRLPD
ncbi:MAG: nitrile hydratase accessory protein [Pseudomonadota bacterium]